MSLSAEENQQRLKAALHFTVGQLCQEVAEHFHRKMSRQVVAAIAETTYRQSDIFAKDLEAFARHAKRSTVSADDVKLTARRSTPLLKHIQNESERLAQEHKDSKKSTAKRKSKDVEEDSRE